MALCSDLGLVIARANASQDHPNHSTHFASVILILIFSQSQSLTRSYGHVLVNRTHDFQDGTLISPRLAKQRTQDLYAAPGTPRFSHLAD